MRVFSAVQSFDPDAAFQLAISCELISWMRPGKSWTEAALGLGVEYVRKNILIERYGFLRSMCLKSGKYCPV